MSEKERVQNGRHTVGLALPARLSLSHWPAKRQLCISAALLVTAGCRTSIDMVTPGEATVSLIKLYERKEYARLHEIIDPAVLWREARFEACSKLIVVKNRCVDDLVQNYDSYMHGRTTPEECRGRSAKEVDGCTCGPIGSAAAKHPPDYLFTDTHRALDTLAPAAKSCTIVDEIVPSNETASKIMGYGDVRCQDVTEGDTLAVVTTECIRQRDKSKIAFKLVFRRMSGTYLFYGMDERSLHDLYVLGLADRAGDAEMVKSRELNKGLR